MIKNALTHSLFVFSLWLLCTLVTDTSYSQIQRQVEYKENFSFFVPKDWTIVSKPDNISTANKSSSGFPFNAQFPYYEQQNNTVVALTLNGISEMDLDRHSYITISVKDLDEFGSNTSSNNNKTNNESLEVLSRNLIDNLSKEFLPNIITKNSTTTLDNQYAFEIIYEPLGCFCLEGYIIGIYDGKLYTIFFHAGEFMKDEVLLDLDTITRTLKFLD